MVLQTRESSWLLHSVGVVVGVGVSVGVGVGVCVAVGAVVGENVAVGGTAVGAAASTTIDTVSVAPNMLCPLDKRQELVYLPGVSGACNSTDSSDQSPTDTDLEILIVSPPRVSPPAETRIY